MSGKFPYGKEFTPHRTPLMAVVALIFSSKGNADRLKQIIRKRYWDSHKISAKNKRTLAMNTYLTLKSYGLIHEVKGQKGVYQHTHLCDELISLAKKKGEKAAHDHFAANLLKNCHGYTLLKVIQNLIDQEIDLSLETINQALTNSGLYLALNSGYVSTMKSWLKRAGVFESETGYAINWKKANLLMGIEDKKLLGEVSHLSQDQLVFLKALLMIGTKDYVPVNKVIDYCKKTLNIQLPTKSLSNTVVWPLKFQRFILARKTTSGRGAKPLEVALSKRAPTETLHALIDRYFGADQSVRLLDAPPLQDVLKNLKSSNKHRKGLALEDLAVWIIRLLGLTFIAWRQRSPETGGAEVDVVAESEFISKSRWLIQCKNQTGTVGPKVIAREVGLCIADGADTILIITTSRYSPDAFTFSRKVMERYPLSIFLIDGVGLEKIKEDRTKIIEVLKSQNHLRSRHPKGAA